MKALSRAPLLGLFILLGVITWHRTFDAVVDFGHQLYVPWRIVEGQVWYRDLLTYYGPLSAQLHALCFKLFGTGLNTLIFFNLAVAWAMLRAWERVFSAQATRSTVTLLSASLLVLAVFANYRRAANFNFITPYSYELTHAVALSVAALAVLQSRSARPSAAKDAALGCLAGLVFLCKAEVFFPLVAALTLGLAVGRAGLKTAARVAAGGLLTAGYAALMLSLKMPVREALGGILLQYRAVFAGGVSALPFYRKVLGTDALADNLLKMAAISVLYVLAAVVVRRGPVKLLRVLPPLMAGAFLALIFAGPEWFKTLMLMDLYRGLPLCLAALCVHLYVRRSPLLPAALFSELLMVKMLFNTHLFHLGFALAVPGFLLAAWAALELLPRQEQGRRVVQTLILLIVLFHAAATLGVCRQRSVKITGRADSFYDLNTAYSSRAAVIQSALDGLQGSLKPGETFTVMPEGVMLNFLTRTPTPSRFLYWNPTQLKLNSQREVIEDFKRARPDYFVLVDRDASEHGYRYFDKDYGPEIYAWIAAHYHPVKRYGAEPFKGLGFGIAVLKRNA